MKNMNMMKKFGAALTAAAMLGSMSIALADEDVTSDIPEAPVVEEPAEDMVEAPILDVEAPAEEEADDVVEAPILDVEEPADEEPVDEEAADAVDLAATEPAKDGNALVPDSTNDSEITISGAMASLKDDVYTVKIEYAFKDGVTAASTSQIAMLAYIFDTQPEGTAAGAVSVVEGKIRAVDQDATTKGYFQFNLAKGDGTNMTVGEGAKMVVKLGANVEGVTKAQAFYIDLSQAKEGGAAVIYGNLNDDEKVTSKDLDVLARYLAEWDGYTSTEYPALATDAADLNDDGKVTSKDLDVLARHLAEWDGYETLPKTN